MMKQLDQLGYMGLHKKLFDWNISIFHPNCIHVFSYNFIHNPLHICGFQCLKTQYINIYSFHTPAKNRPWILIPWLGSNMKRIQYQVDIIPTQVKKENKETTTTNLLRETKKCSNCSNHLQSGHLFEGEKVGFHTVTMLHNLTLRSPLLIRVCFVTPIYLVDNTEEEEEEDGGFVHHLVHAKRCKIGR